MKRVINLGLVAIAVFLGFWLYKTIQDPINFQAEQDKSIDHVVEALKKIKP